MEVVIERLDHQGRGIAYINGKITFVNNALPGEIVDVNIFKNAKKFNEGSVIKYIKRRPKRVDSVCPYYENCGGCNLMHLSYDDQLEYKEEKIKNIMTRFANVDYSLIKNIVPSPKKINYRNKITLKSNSKLGYYKEGTNEIVNIDYCYLAEDLINKTIKKINEIGLDKNISEVMIRSVSDDDMVVTFSLQDSLTNIEKYDEVSKKINFISKKNIDISNVNSNIIGRLENFCFKISPTSFFQVNTNQTINLYNKISEFISELDSPVVLDLYCGTGTIGLYCSKNIKKLIGVEINKAAVLDAKENAKINGINNATFYAGDTKNILNNNSFSCDIVIVDPPRAGLDTNVIEDIIKISPKRVIYVSCDPITLARDIKLFSNLYKVNQIIPFDMFPNTYHVESVVLLERK